MKWWQSLIGVGIAEPIDAVGNAVDKIFTNEEDRAKADFVMAKLRQHPHILQAEMNLSESRHRSVFVAGWRPALGWACAFALLIFLIRLQ